jgi:predicted DNA-binding transcriptional regulator YafY
MYHPTTRVLTVLELLQARGQLSGAEIAERLEINVRTVRRYVAMLQDLGIPIEGTRGRHGAYKLAPGFRLPPLMFADDEALALTLGLIAARRLGLVVDAPSVAGALAKLERALPAALRERVQAVESSLVVQSPPDVRTPDRSVVMTLGLAAQRRQRVTVRHRSFNGALTERQLDPYGLVYRSGFWYAVGDCQLRNALRVFRLDRMEAVTIEDTCFPPPPAIDLLVAVERSLAATPGRWQIDVLLHTPREPDLCRLPREIGTLEPTPDGLLLRCQVQDLAWFAYVLAGLDCSFTVIAPDELRTELRSLAARLVAGADPGPVG